jgi:cytochrome b involved in lipid metabolism
MFASRHGIRRLVRPSTLRMTSRITKSAFATDAQNKAARTVTHENQNMAAMFALMGLALGGAGVALMEPRLRKSPPSSPFQRPGIPVEDPNTPPPRPDLPTIPLEDVAEHSDESSLWYTFRGAVYDMTFFINGHPGGTPVSQHHS